MTINEFYEEESRRGTVALVLGAQRTRNARCRICSAVASEILLTRT